MIGLVRRIRLKYIVHTPFAIVVSLALGYTSQPFTGSVGLGSGFLCAE